MINKQELKDLLTATQVTLLQRICKLTEASKLIDDIRSNMDEQERIYTSIQICQSVQLRALLHEQEMELDEVERDLWNKMLDIMKSVK